MQPCRDDGKLLLHAVGVGAHGLGKILCKAEGVGIFCNALGALFFAHTVDIGDEVQVFYAGKVLVKLGVIGDVGHLPFAFNRAFLYRQAVNENVALFKLQDAAAGLDGRGLACSVMADKRIDITGFHLKAQVIDGGLAVIHLAEILNFKHLLLLLFTWG